MGSRIKTFILIAAALAFGLAAVTTGCKKQSQETTQQKIKQEEEPDNIPPAAGTSLTDEQWLLLVEYLPLGESYDEVKGRFISLGPAGPEGGMQSLGEAGLTQATMKVNVLDHDEALEFNFRHDSLYSYYYTAAKLDTTSAGDLWGYLNEFYTQHFGVSRQETDSEATYYLQTAIWATDEFDVILSLRLETAGPASVIWGFQAPVGK
jgi:hypothetical protein